MGLVGFRKPPVRGRTGRNPPIKPILIQDMQNPQKRPSKKTKALRARILTAKEMRKAALAVRAKQAQKGSLIAAALHGPRAKSRGKQRKAGKLR